MKGFASICKGYRYQRVEDPKTLQSLRNALANFNGEKGKAERLSEENFKWLVQATHTQEGGLVAIDLLCKIRSKSLYPFEEVSHLGADICLTLLQNKGIDQFILAMGKMDPFLLNPDRAECLKAVMLHPEVHEKKNCPSSLQATPPKKLPN